MSRESCWNSWFKKRLLLACHYQKRPFLIHSCLNPHSPPFYDTWLWFLDLPWFKASPLFSASCLLQVLLIFETKQNLKDQLWEIQILTSQLIAKPQVFNANCTLYLWPYITCKKETNLEKVAHSLISVLFMNGVLRHPITNLYSLLQHNS